MPMKEKNIPDTLPAGAKAIFRGAFNSSHKSCMMADGGTMEKCDQRAAQIAWTAVKKVYKKDKDDKWVKKD